MTSVRNTLKDTMTKQEVGYGAINDTYPQTQKNHHQITRRTTFVILLFVTSVFLVAAVDVATKTPNSTKISSSVNYLIGGSYTCEKNGCGLSNFIPTEDCEWGDATFYKDKGDQQGQKPGCTFCYSSEEDSEDSFKAFWISSEEKRTSKAYRNQQTALSGVCKFKLPIGAECNSWYLRYYGGEPRFDNRGSNEHCMTNKCVSDDPNYPHSYDPNYPHSNWHCKA